MDDNKTSTSQLSIDRNRYSASGWGVTGGLVAAVILMSVLYVSFSGNLTEEPSTAVPPPATSAPSTGPATSVQPSAPSTK